MTSSIRRFELMGCLLLSVSSVIMTNTGSVFQPELNWDHDTDTRAHPYCFSLKKKKILKQPENCKQKLAHMSSYIKSHRLHVKEHSNYRSIGQNVTFPIHLASSVTSFHRREYCTVSSQDIIVRLCDDKT